MADANIENVEDLLNDDGDNDETAQDLLDEEADSELAENDETQGSATNDDSAILGESTHLDNTNEDAELEAIKNRMKEMEEEARKLREFQAAADDSLNMSGGSLPAVTSTAEKKEIDGRSIYVGNVDYGATAEELENHFHGCGPVNRVTILCDKYTGHPKGFAYVEFSESDAVEAAQMLDESLFRGRQIKVGPKRTNIPGHSITNRPPRGRGRGFRSPRGYRGYRGGRAPYRGAYRGRGRYSTYYSPY